MHNPATPVTVVDYGLGNIFSVTRALESAGALVTVSDDPGVIRRARRIVLPGVGAFSDGMKGLRDRGLVEPLQNVVESGARLLGICLGMQMLAATSEEFGSHEGLGLISGHVAPIPDRDTEGRPLKSPHIGWTALDKLPEYDWAHSMLDDTANGTPVYLVHSFAMVPENHGDRLADCIYGGWRVSTAICRGRILGCQFHPEKSGPAGLAMLRAFLKLPI